VVGVLPSREETLPESRVVVLTGCASGIGRQLATALFQRGDRILVSDVDRPRLEAEARAGFHDPERVDVLGLDVRDAAAWDAAIERAVARWGRVDVLLNVAGYLAAGWAHEMSAEIIHRTIDVNVKGVMFGTTAAARQMVRQGSGHIVNFASLAAVAAVPGIAIYAASKHAVRGFSLGVAQELAPHGVAVTVVCPGLVATPMLDTQVVRPEAALTFATARPLSVDEVVAAVLGRGLDERPLELFVTVPRSGQVALSKLGNAFPALAARLASRLIQRGRENQAELAKK
jgi:NAD(P)-dependent dehydrogenase (short-subunit alcohol dehydrogenase family)